MKQLLVLFSTVILFANCNNNKGWSVADRQKGLKACMDQVEGKIEDATAKKYCSCIIDKAMKKYATYSEADKGTTEDGTLMGQACLKELQLGGNTGNQEDGLKGEKKDGGIFGGIDEEGGKKKIIDEDGGGAGWSTTDKNAFLTPCTDGLVQKGYSNSQARQLCSCSLEKLQKQYSSMKDAEDRGGEAAGTRVMKECLNGTNDDN